MPLPLITSSLSERIERDHFQIDTELIDSSLQKNYWPRVLKKTSLNNLETKNPYTKLEIITDRKRGKAIGFEERFSSNSSTPTNSTSLTRKPASIQDFARGNPSNFPFLPGGLTSKKEKQGMIEEKLDLDKIFEFEKGLLEMPPGFTEAVKFDKGEQKEEKNLIILGQNPPELIKKYKQVNEEERRRMIETNTPEEKIVPDSGIFNFANTLLKGAGDDPFDESEDSEETDESGEDESGEDESEESNNDEKSKKEEPQNKETLTIENKKESDEKESKGKEEKEEFELAQLETRVQKELKEEEKKKKSWAVMDRLSMIHFNELVPQMAIEYKFDLDKFQKGKQKFTIILIMIFYFHRGCLPHGKK